MLIGFLKAMHFLQPGDTVEIIALASKFNFQILKQVHEVMNNWNLKVKISCPMSGEEWLCTTNEKERFEALYSALLNPVSKVVWNVWGGYGCMHLLPFLSQISPPAKPKLLMGFSDTTSLHLFLNSQWNWPSLHCPSAAQIALNRVSKKSIDLLKNWLFGHLNPYILELTALNMYSSEKEGDFFAPVIGGNLSIVISSLGTPWQIKSNNKFLFLEETGEKAYRVDRMLHQLLQAGILNKIKGLILGEFIQKDTLKMDEQTNLIIQKWSKMLTVPVFSCKIGHGKHNYPILLNWDAQLILSQKPHLKFKSF